METEHQQLDVVRVYVAPLSESGRPGPWQFAGDADHGAIYPRGFFNQGFELSVVYRLGEVWMPQLIAFGERFGWGYGRRYNVRLDVVDHGSVDPSQSIELCEAVFDRKATLPGHPCETFILSGHCEQVRAASTHASAA